MRRILGFLLLTLAIALPAWPQSTDQQNPIHTQSFDSALPRESFECSATQATLGTHMVNFLDTNGSVSGYVDCHGVIHGTSGSGTVTSFTAGDLNPLFTTSVATGTTTPDLTFTLDTAAAGSIFGNFTSSAAVPGFTTPETCGDTTHAVSFNVDVAFGFGCQTISGGGSPGSPDGSIQGNNAGALGGVPGSSIDFVNGTVAISPTGIGIALALSSDAMGNIALFLDCVTPSVSTGGPCLYSQTTTTDNSGGGNFGYAGLFGALISGTDMTGDTVFGIQASAASNGTGSPLEVTGYFAQGSNGSNPDPPQIISGVHIADQHSIPPAALTLNAGLIVDSQTVGADVYGIHDANGLFTFQGWNAPETDTLANLTTQATGLPSEGFQKLCSDCDTPIAEGSVCTSAGDMAGALALYIRGALLCF